MTYDDIMVNDQIPPLVIEVSSVLMTAYCAITWDFFRLHYDSAFINERGFSKPLVDPQMHGGFIARMVTDWIAETGMLAKLSLSYRSACMLGDTLTYRARVVKKYEKNNKKCIDCDFVVNNQKDESPVTGYASVVFY